MSEIEPKLTITYGVSAYDESFGGYGDNRSREFTTPEAAIEYAKLQPENYRATVWKTITMERMSQKLWPKEEEKDD